MIFQLQPIFGSLLWERFVITWIKQSFCLFVLTQSNLLLAARCSKTFTNFCFPLTTLISTLWIFKEQPYWSGNPESTTKKSVSKLLWCWWSFDRLDKWLVEDDGIEPTTPCLQSMCSPSWANPPVSSYRIQSSEFGGSSWARTNDPRLIKTVL